MHRPIRNDDYMVFGSNKQWSVLSSSGRLIVACDKEIRSEQNDSGTWLHVI